jgi:arabinogalactan endo-1,4-beta-galactosidase
MKGCFSFRVLAFFLMLFSLFFFCNSCAGVEKSDRTDAVAAIFLTENYRSSSFMHGFDASMVYEIEKKGGIYRDKNGNSADIFALLKNYGVNWIRLRLWHTPDMDDVNLSGHNDLARTVEIARRIKDSGLGFLLDIHFSDTWADPGNQKYPAAWDSVSSVEELKNLVSDYTAHVLTSLKEVPPDMVQLGNEINPGFLVTASGAASVEDFAKISCSSYKSDETVKNFMEVFYSASKTVRKICPDAKIMVHLSSDKGESLRWWFQKFKKIDFDVIGISYYPFENHGTQKELEQNIAELKANFNKDVVVVETSWAWTTGWKDEKTNVFYTEQEKAGAEKLTELRTSGGTAAATKYGQKAVLASIIESCKRAGGIGVFYWGGDWISCDNVLSSWENQALFDFEGKITPAAEAFLEN